MTTEMIAWFYMGGVECCGQQLQCIRGIALHFSDGVLTHVIEYNGQGGKQVLIPFDQYVMVVREGEPTMIAQEEIVEVVVDALRKLLAEAYRHGQGVAELRAVTHVLEVGKEKVVRVTFDSDFDTMWHKEHTICVFAVPAAIGELLERGCIHKDKLVRLATDGDVISLALPDMVIADVLVPGMEVGVEVLFRSDGLNVNVRGVGEEPAWLKVLWEVEEETREPLVPLTCQGLNEEDVRRIEEEREQQARLALMHLLPPNHNYHT